MTYQKRIHVCASCDKEWLCPTEYCESMDKTLCSKCFNKAKKHLVTEFGGKN